MTDAVCQSCEKTFKTFNAHHDFAGVGSIFCSAVCYRTRTKLLLKALEFNSVEKIIDAMDGNRPWPPQPE